MVRFAKIVVDILCDRQDDRCEGHGFHWPHITLDQIGRYNIIALQGLGGIIRVFRARNKGHGVKGIAFSPLDHFFAGIQREARARL